MHHKELPNIIDHKNRDKLDNRIENLRPANDSKNNQNKEKYKGCVSKFIGVTLNKKHKSKPWVCRVFKDNVNVFYCVYDNEEVAAYAYNVNSKKHHMEYSCLNEESLFENDIDWIKSKYEDSQKKEQKLVGVVYRKDINKYHVRICVEKRTIFLGNHKNLDVAIKTYNQYIKDNNIDKPLNPVNVCGLKSQG